MADEIFSVEKVHGKLGYLGPRPTISGNLAGKIAYTDSNLVPYESILNVLDATRRGEVDYGLVPLEPLSGRLIWVDKLLMYCDNVNMLQTIRIPVKFCLAGYGEAREIKEIHSKEEALIQCAPLIWKTMPTTKLIPDSSTAAAAEKISQSKSREKAVVCSKEAAEKYGLDIINENIGVGSTIFYLLSSKKESPQYDPSEKYSTLVLYSIPESDKPNTLNNSLIFGKYGVNLININSIPVDREDGSRDYIFSVLAEIHKDKGQLKLALEELKEMSSFLYVKGSAKVVDIKLPMVNNGNSNSKVI